MPQHETLHFWTYNDKPLEDLDRETMQEALGLALEENQKLREQVHMWQLQLAEEWKRLAGAVGHA